jgi:hypothetical protein
VLPEAGISSGDRRLSSAWDRATEGVELPVLAEQVLGQWQCDVEQAIEVVLGRLGS